MLQDENQPLHLALQGEHIEIARLLLEKGARLDAVDVVGAWECGHVHKHGYAWQSAWLLVGAVFGMLQRGHLRQVLMHPWCCAAVWKAAAALC